MPSLYRSGILPGCCLAALLLAGPSAEAQDRRDAIDLMIHGDTNGVVGLRVFRWDPVGMFFGVKYSFFSGPEGNRRPWHAVTAEAQMLDSYLGYSRERFLGLQVGIAGYDPGHGAVFFGGFGIVSEKRFRQYRDEDPYRGHRTYYILDRLQQHYRPDLTLGVFKLGKRYNLGMSFSTATRGLELLLGFTFDQWTLWFGDP